MKKTESRLEKEEDFFVLYNHSCIPSIVSPISLLSVQNAYTDKAPEYHVTSSASPCPFPGGGAGGSRGNHLVQL